MKENQFHKFEKQNVIVRYERNFNERQGFSNINVKNLPLIEINEKKNFVHVLTATF